MKLNKFLIAFVIGLSFILISYALAQDPEEPLISIFLSEDFDIETASKNAPIFADALHLPDYDDEAVEVVRFIVGPNIVNDPQFFNVPNPPANTNTPPFNLVGRSETAIAVDEEGENIVVGWNDAEGFVANLLGGTSGWGFSANAGASFVDGGGMPSGTIPTSPPTTIVVAGDPWLEVLKEDSDGDGSEDDQVFLYANLAVRLTGPGTGHAVEGVAVHRGTVTGGVLTWGTPTLIPSPSPVMAPLGVFQGLDKEAIATDKRDGSNAVYVSATDFSLVPSPLRQISRILLFRSFDEGLTFSGPTLVQGEVPDGVQGSMPAVGPNGDVYVVWERGRFNHPLVTPANPNARIQFARSTDGGATFSSAVDVAVIRAAARKPPTGYNRSRHNDFPRIAVAQNGPHKGRIYVVYHTTALNPDGTDKNLPGTITLTGVNNPALPAVADADAFLKFSDDGGVTWSSGTVINGAVGDGKYQFWPCVSVDEEGNVHVTYHEDDERTTPVNTLIRGLDGVAGRTRFSARSSMVDVFLARSNNGGVTFGTPVKISDVSSNWSATRSNIIPNMGDYITSVSLQDGDERIFATWADSRVLADIVSGPGVLLRPVPSVAYASIDVVEYYVFDPDINAIANNFPKSPGLVQNYPNPFNASTIIEYSLPSDGFTTVTVYNLLGQKVAKLVDEFQPAGKHRVKFDASDLSSGVYFYMIESGKLRESNRMTLLK